MDGDSEYGENLVYENEDGEEVTVSSTESDGGGEDETSRIFPASIRHIEELFNSPKDLSQMHCAWYNAGFKILLENAWLYKPHYFE